MSKPLMCVYCGHCMKDLSQGLGKGRHYYCDKCHAHYYQSYEVFSEIVGELKWYSAKEWEKEFN